MIMVIEDFAGNGTVSVAERREMLLLEYACGALDIATALMVESWLCLSSDARAAVAQYEIVGGALMCQDCPPERMKDESLRHVLDRLDCQKRAAARAHAAEAQAMKAAIMALPAPLQAYLSGHPSWHGLTRGVDMFELAVPDCTHAMLFRSSPGASVHYPDFEMTLVLEGGFSDGETVYHRGDLLLGQNRSTARYVADPSQGCLSFVISEDAPKQASGLMGFFRSFFKR